jgi:hypothetical protein
VIPTTAGSTYEVQKTPALVAGSWTTLQTISGDGTAKTVAVPAGETAGFVRIQTR